MPNSKCAFNLRCNLIVDDTNENCESTLLDTNQRRIKKKWNWRFIYDICIFNLGIFTTVLGILSVIFPILYLLMHDLIKMRPGTPTYELWSNPQPEVLVKVRIFNFTNSNKFLNGTAKKMEFIEMEPIIYREIINYSNITRHLDNSTLSYTVERSLEFLPDRNEPGILNRTIIVPNTSLLGMASHLQDYMYLIKIAFNHISRNDEIFVNTTVYNFLWNISTPALESIRTFLPNYIPLSNGGILYNLYADPVDRINVKIGEKYGFNNFFKINTVNDRTFSNGYYPENGDCSASIINSTEGSLFNNYLNENSSIITYRKTSCRTFLFKFKEKTNLRGLLGYKYEVSLDSFDREKDLNQDCFKGVGSDVYPNGMYDVSKCYKNVPIALSLPHFYGRSGPWNQQYKGFAPSKEKHLSTMIIEPIIGAPLKQKICIQTNYKLSKLTGYRHEILKFSEYVVPQCWFEYNMADVTFIIKFLLILTSNILPIGQYIISFILIIGGIFLILISTFSLTGYKSLQEILIFRCIFKIKNKVIS